VEQALRGVSDTYLVFARHHGRQRREPRSIAGGQRRRKPPSRTPAPGTDLGRCQAWEAGDGASRHRPPESYGGSGTGRSPHRSPWTLWNREPGTAAVGVANRQDGRAPASSRASARSGEGTMTGPPPEGPTEKRKRMVDSGPHEATVEPSGSQDWPRDPPRRSEPHLGAARSTQGLEVARGFESSVHVARGLARAARGAANEVRRWSAAGRPPNAAMHLGALPAAGGETVVARGFGGDDRRGVGVSAHTQRRRRATEVERLAGGPPSRRPGTSVPRRGRGKAARRPRDRRRRRSGGRACPFGVDAAASRHIERPANGRDRGRRSAARRDTGPRDGPERRPRVRWRRPARRGCFGTHAATETSHRGRETGERAPDRRRGTSVPRRRRGEPPRRPTVRQRKPRRRKGFGPGAAWVDAAEALRPARGRRPE
jgi:hypothetical protein